jgi:sporulation protein YlmC with PRC-barrel domain
MRSHIIIGLLAGTLLSGTAWSQTSTTPANAGQQGNATAPVNQTQGAAPSQGATVSQQAGSIQYVTQNRADLWRASKLEGVNVYNQNNEKIGDISEVLVNRQGQVEAVVIGVGGFLGIGERDVAVPYSALQWQNQEQNARSSTTPATGQATTADNLTAANSPAGTGTAATTIRQTAANAPANNPAMNDRTGMPSTTGAVGASRGVIDTAGDRMRDYPERAVLPNATKEQLERAPQFRYAQ